MHCLDKHTHIPQGTQGTHFTIHPFGLPLKMSIGVSNLPEAVTVKAHVACFVPDVDLRIWTVQMPTTSRVDLAL